MKLETNVLYYGDNLEILDGKRVEMPPQRSPFAEAPVEREKAKTKRLL